MDWYGALTAIGVAGDFIAELLTEDKVRSHNLSPADFQRVTNEFIKAHADNPKILAKIQQRMESINIPYNMSHQVNKALAKYQRDLSNDYDAAVAADQLAKEAKSNLAETNMQFSSLSNRNKRKMENIKPAKESMAFAKNVSALADKTMNELGERYV